MKKTYFYAYYVCAGVSFANMFNALLLFVGATNLGNIGICCIAAIAFQFLSMVCKSLEEDEERLEQSLHNAGCCAPDLDLVDTPLGCSLFIGSQLWYTDLGKEIEIADIDVDGTLTVFAVDDPLQVHFEIRDYEIDLHEKIIWDARTCAYPPLPPTADDMPF